MTFSPDGTLLASAAVEPVLKLGGRVWHVPSARLLREFKGHITWVHGLAFTPDGRTLATGSTDGTILLWNVTTGQELLGLARPGLMVGSLRFSPDGERLAAGVLRRFGATGSIELWRAPSLAEMAAREQIRQAEQSR